MLGDVEKMCLLKGQFTQIIKYPIKVVMSSGHMTPQCLPYRMCHYFSAVHAVIHIAGTVSFHKEHIFIDRYLWRTTPQTEVFDTLEVLEVV